MGVLTTVILILGALSLVCAVVGLFQPKAVLHAKRTTAFAAYALASVVLFGGGAMLLWQSDYGLGIAKAKNGRALVAQAPAPFEIVERTTARERFGVDKDQVIFVVKSDVLDPENRRAIATKLLDQAGQSAVVMVYFYAPAKTPGKDMPDHRIIWVKGKGYTQDY